MPNRLRPVAEIRRRLKARNAHNVALTQSIEDPRREPLPPEIIPIEPDFIEEDAALQRAGYEYTPDPMGRLDRGAWTDRQGRVLSSVARERILRNGRRPIRQDDAASNNSLNNVSVHDGESSFDGDRGQGSDEIDVAIWGPIIRLLLGQAAKRAPKKIPLKDRQPVGQGDSNAGSQPTASTPRSMTPPLPTQTPPFPGEPSEDPRDGRHETPADRIEGGALVNPIPPGLRPEDTVTIYPDQSELFQNFIYERKGSERIRVANSNVRGVGERIVEKNGLTARHVGGARNKYGKEIEETYLKPKKGGRRGGSFLDVTFEAKNGRRLLINTVDTRADGKTPSTPEFNASLRIMINSKNGDIHVLIPKLPEGKEYDLDKLEEFLTPLFLELEKPVPKIDPGASDAPEELWHLFDPFK